MSLSTTHIITSILAVLITMAPGIYAARKIKNADDYAVGGRSSGIGMVAAAILGTLIGGGSTMGTAQMAYKIGFSAWNFSGLTLRAAERSAISEAKSRVP